MKPRSRVVLYQPQTVDQRRGGFASHDLLPLEMLSIAAIPAAEGVEVVVATPRSARTPIAGCRSR